MSADVVMFLLMTVN